MRNKRVLKYIKPEAAFVIKVWRMLLVLLYLNEETFGAPLELFRTRSPQALIWYDSSLTGVGVSVYLLSGGVKNRIAVIQMKFPFDLEEQAKFQNVAEFIAVVVGCCVLVQKGYRDMDLKLIGDSESSLTWGLTENFRSHLGFGATLVYILLGTAFGLYVVEKEHVRGVDNGFHDSISRDVELEDLGVERNVMVKPTHGDILTELVALCDPTTDLTDRTVEAGDKRLIHFWRRVSNSIERLRCEHAEAAINSSTLLTDSSSSH
jgi:hypothetical protein